MKQKAVLFFTRFLVSLFLLGFFVPLSAQTATGTGNQKNSYIFRGIVVDDGNEPLPGVSVMVKGVKGVGAATNVNGEFTITYTASKCTLSFSYVGMKSREVSATAGKRLTVQLENDAETLAETVVNGIYTRNIESFTGSVSTFSADQLKAIAPQGILKSLSYLDPSVILTESVDFGSDPNKLADININGKMNVQALSQEYETDPNRPLFILDGFESDLQTISDLNMDRVESISILKDASATAIYGSKAANGVIVVETKKPSAGRLRVSYNASLQVAWADLSDYNMMNAKEKLQFELLSGVYNNNAAGLGLDKDGLPLDEQQRIKYMEKKALVEQGYDTYWMNEPLRTAYTQNHNLYIDGGDQAFRYGAGLSYGKTEGVMKGSDRDVINGNITLTYRVDRFSFTNQTTINHTSSQIQPVEFYEFVKMNPFYPKYADNGEIPKYVFKDASGDKVYNPLWDMVQSSFNKGTIMGITDNFQFEWRVTRSLRLRGNAQYNTSHTNNEVFKSPNATQFDKTTDLMKRGTYTNTNINSTRWSGRLNATYGLYFGPNTINMVGGLQVQETSTKSQGYGVQGYLNDKFSNPSFAVGYPSGGKPSSTENKTRSVSYYANLNYAYDMRYLLDLNLSRNGASQFGIDDPFTNTWSVGVGWNVHNEKWFGKNSIIQYLKLNASYGNPGNQNYDAKLASSIYSYFNTYSNPFGTAAIVTTWGNSGLRWQKTKTYNVGTTVNMFNKNLTFSVNYQIRKTEPQLVRIALPSSTGIGSNSAPMNVGGTDNRSISANATYYIIKKNDFNWYLSGNLNHNTTKYYNIGNSLDQYNESGRASQSLERMYDGASITGLYVVRSAGIDPATGNEVFIRKDGTYTFEWNSSDEVLYGDSNPKLTGNFSTSFLYKGFTFGATFSFRTGADVYLSTLMSKVENYGSANYNQDKRALYDRWQKPGDIAKYKRIDDTSTTNKSSRFIATEHTLQCASISIGYRSTSWPFIQKIGATSFDIRAYMNDIFRISNIKEERGLTYPFQRSVSMSLGISF